MSIIKNIKSHSPYFWFVLLLAIPVLIVEILNKLYWHNPTVLLISRPLEWFLFIFLVVYSIKRRKKSKISKNNKFN